MSNDDNTPQASIHHSGFIEKWLDKLPEWVLGIIGFAALLPILFLVGNIYRQFQMLWVYLWFSIPVIAYLVSSGRLNAYLTLKGIKYLHIWLMVYAVFMSLVVCFDRDLKERFGTYYIKGAQFWYADKGIMDDYGYSVFSQEYYAPTAWGRFVLGGYDLVTICLCLLIPYLLHKAFARSIATKKRDRYEQESVDSIRKDQPR